MKKNAIEEHFSIDGVIYKNDVMDAPTFGEVRHRLADTELLRIEAMDAAGMELSILSFCAWHYNQVLFASFGYISPLFTHFFRARQRDLC